MTTHPAATSAPDAAEPAYREVLQQLNAAAVPYLVGGTYAYAGLTGIERQTKDLDLFVRRADYPRVEAAMRAAGHDTELTYPHWLGKVRAGSADVDLIFDSGNGLTAVDDAWFAHAPAADVLGVPVRLVPAEEMIWSKAFVMERERYDGGDVAHLLRACAARIDWPRLVGRFGPNWRVLLAHLMLFGFVYPGLRATVPDAVMDDLLGRLARERAMPPPAGQLCRGTLLSREQYLPDVEQQGWQDARMTPASSMTPADVANWTEAIAARNGD